MKEKLTQIFVVIAITAITTTNLQAQVRIGSSEPALPGALLDLRQDGLTTKGLLLPRVQLIDLQNSDISKTIKDVSANAYTGDHTGLTVYNPGETCSTNEQVIYKGLYVWNGSLWTPIMQKKEYPVSSLEKTDMAAKTLTDRDGNVYKIHTFNNNVGTWMVENLRTKHLAGMVEIAEGNGSSRTNMEYSYPVPDASYSYYAPGGPSSWRTEYGLLYNWTAATAGRNCIVVNQTLAVGLGSPPGENEVENREELGYIQGICPTGWHLPSDREWSALEKEMTENAMTYSTASTNQTWGASGVWETMISWWRDGGQGNAMKSPIQVKGLDGNDIGTATQGLSHTDGTGFNVYLTGYIQSGIPKDYGSSAVFWASSAIASSYAWTRQLAYNQNGTTRINSLGGRANAFSVRCKKND